LEKIQYKKYNWNIMEDLKVNARLLGYTSSIAFCVSGIVGT